TPGRVEQSWRKGWRAGTDSEGSRSVEKTRAARHHAAPHRFHPGRTAAAPPRRSPMSALRDQQRHSIPAGRRLDDEHDAPVQLGTRVILRRAIHHETVLAVTDGTDVRRDATLEQILTHCIRTTCRELLVVRLRTRRIREALHRHDSPGVVLADDVHEAV